MPRVHFVKKAQKNYGEIKKGQSYYWWKFRYADKSRSLTYPKPQQLTRSAFWSQIYDLQDELNGVDNKDALEDIVNRIRDLAVEQDEKRMNMPDQLQDIGSGETLMNRQEALDEWADELEELDIDDEDFNFDDIPSYSGE